jgi:hypothetical protein
MSAAASGGLRAGNPNRGVKQMGKKATKTLRVNTVKTSQLDVTGDLEFISCRLDTLAVVANFLAQCKVDEDSAESILYHFANVIWAERDAINAAVARMERAS